MGSICRIIGTKKSNAVKAVLRYFRERSLQYQFVDILAGGLTPGELRSICNVVHPADLIDEKSAVYAKRGYAYMEYDPYEELQDYPLLLKMPIVRLGNKVLVQPDIADLDFLFKGGKN